MPLTAAQATFVEYYIKTGSATESAIAAGIPLYAASQQASDWMCNVEVIKAINRGQVSSHRSIDDDRIDVMQHAVAMATSDITQAFETDPVNGEFKIRSLNDMPYKLRRAIKKISIHETPVPYDDRPKRRISLELYDKNNAIANVIRMIGLDTGTNIQYTGKELEALGEADLDTVIQNLSKIGRQD